MNSPVRDSHYCPTTELSSGCEWFALYVRSKHEFVVHKDLVRKSIETFLPAVERRNQWKDRQKLVRVPLFPGYLFVNINPRPEDFLNVLKTVGAVSLISSERGNPTPVPVQEIISLRLLLKNTRDFDIYPHLKEGARIRVKRGPLKGVEGVMKIKEDQYICIINVELLGRSVGVKICADDLEPA